jgi:hypothetical protein
MEISLNLRQLVLGAAAICLIVLLAVVGHAVTPVAEGSPSWAPRLVLTPERWEAAALARKAGAEIVRLEADGRALRAAVAAQPPDAVQAMLLAQRIYAGQRSGTAATATARAALVDAAADVARYAGGGLARQAAIEAVNAALERIQALRGRAMSRISSVEQGRHVAFLPLASVGFAGREPDGLRAGRAADR